MVKNVLEFAGFAAITAGLALISVPVALIFVGIMLVVGANL